MKKVKVGRNEPCPCGKTDKNGKPIKFKKCCIDIVKSGKKAVVSFSRNDLISGPYKECPSCRRPKSFGVFSPISGSGSYTRECTECHHEENIQLPMLQKKKVVYLDQFVISNLIKLLDTSHPRHNAVANGTLGQFWKDLFVALEKASKSQALVCPDSFYHKDEFSTGGIDFKIARRLYEHFSYGKTLYPSSVVEQLQIKHHFADWLDGKKSNFSFNPQDIAFGEDLNEWEIGLRVSVGGSPRPGELENLKKVNASTQQQLAEIWKRWQEETVDLETRAIEEVLGFGKGMMQVMKNFLQRRASAMQRIATDPSYQIDINDIIPPPASELMEELMRIARLKGVPEQEQVETIARYLSDAEALLEVPYLRISSVMFAGLAHTASLGEKKPPKSTVDVQFISSYLPYCDAMFVDKQSARMLKELPKDTPEYLRLKEFDTKIFTLNEKEDLLKYLESIVSELPLEQMEALRDVEGERFMEPYWAIIEHEKISLRSEMEEASSEA